MSVSTPERDEPTMTDPRPELTNMLEVVWAISQLNAQLIRRAQARIDECPVSDAISLITAINTRDALIISARRTVGWQRKKAA